MNVQQTNTATHTKYSAASSRPLQGFLQHMERIIGPGGVKKTRKDKKGSSWYQRRFSRNLARCPAAK